MKLPHRALLVIAAAGLGLLAGLWQNGHLQGTAVFPSSPAVNGVVEGDHLPPELTLHGRDGQAMPLVDYRGRPLLINVWASWCAPCIEEMPELARFAAEQGSTGVQVVGLALDTPEAVQAFLDRVPVPYPIAIETPGPHDASVALGNDRGLLPYTVLVDDQGVVRKRKLGPFKSGEITAWATTP